MIVQVLGPTTNLVEVNATNAPTGRSQNVFLDVTGEPVVNKTYDVVANVPFASTSRNSAFNLTISVDNRRGSATLMQFTDNLPPQLVVIGNATVSCSPAASQSDCILLCPNVTATTGSSTITMEPELMQALTKCVYQIPLNATASGQTYNFLTVFGPTFNTSTGWVPLFVLDAAVMTKRYSASSFALGGPTLLTIQLRNPNDFPMINAQFNDTFPPQIRGPATATAVTSGFGCPTATIYPDRFELLPSTIPNLGRCTYQYIVTGAIAGDSNNTVCSFASNAPLGCSPAARTYVMLAPNVTKTYPVDSFPVSTTVNMTITLTNTNDFVLRQASFQDNLPFGMSLASLPFDLNCPYFPGGNFSNSSLTTFQVLNVDIPPNTTCSFTLSIFAAFPGVTRNGITVISTNAPAAQLLPVPYAEVYVMDVINVNPRYTDPYIEQNGTTTLIISVNNTNNNFAARCLSFNETLDSKVAIVSITTTNATNGLNMTTNATVYGNSFSIQNITLGPLQGFEIRIVVKGLLPGNVTGPIIDVTTCNTPPSSSKEPFFYIMQCANVSIAYGAASVPVGGSTSFNVTIANPNAFSIQDAEFTRAIPSNLIITQTVVVVQGGAGCGTASVSGQNLVVTGATVLPSASCSYILPILTGKQMENGPFFFLEKIGGSHFFFDFQGDPREMRLFRSCRSTRATPAIFA